MSARRTAFTVVVSFVLLVSWGAAYAGVVPPDSRKYGMNYSELSARWFQWAFGIPVPDNPVLDPTGEKCAIGQLGPVWLLAVTFFGEGERFCTVPADKAIFFPVINFENSVAEENAGIECGFGSDEAGLRACADFWMDHVTRTEASVDGVPLAAGDISRVQSPLFEILVPEPDNVFAFFGSEALQHPVPNPTPAVSDGFWVLLDPLPKGRHVIKFHGVLFIPEFGDFEFENDMTYNLTVK